MELGARQFGGREDIRGPDGGTVGAQRLLRSRHQRPGSAFRSGWPGMAGFRQQGASHDDPCVGSGPQWSCYRGVVYSGCRDRQEGTSRCLRRRHTESWFVRARDVFPRDARLRGSASLFLGGTVEAGWAHAPYLDWNGELYDEIMDAVTWAAARPDVDASRICIVGRNNFRRLLRAACGGAQGQSCSCAPPACRESAISKNDARMWRRRAESRMNARRARAMSRSQRNHPCGAQRNSTCRCCWSKRI